MCSHISSVVILAGKSPLEDQGMLVNKILIPDEIHTQNQNSCIKFTSIPLSSLVYQHTSDLYIAHSRQFFSLTHCISQQACSSAISVPLVCL